MAQLPTSSCLRQGLRKLVVDCTPHRAYFWHPQLHLVPSLYIAFVNFHQEVIPTKLACNGGYRSGVPFTALVEAFLMELTFELLREAGIRLPARSRLLLVSWAVLSWTSGRECRQVSPIMVIVVALTAIGSFAIPSFNVALSIRILPLDD